jgi:hypothetical protein
MNSDLPETISIDDVDFDVNSMSDTQRYFVAQIKDLQAKSAQLRFSLDQITVAKDLFTEKLLNAIKETQNKEDAA